VLRPDNEEVRDASPKVRFKDPFRIFDLHQKDQIHTSSVTFVGHRKVTRAGEAHEKFNRKGSSRERFLKSQDPERCNAATSS
jgi:hypothetical protein